jgi:hypothetical protein
MIRWTPIAEYLEPDWARWGTDVPPLLFWRAAKGAALGYVRDGELFDSKWLYVCDANKISHFSTVNTPNDDTIDKESSRANG